MMAKWGSWCRALGAGIHFFIAKLASHPVRAAGLALLGGALVWLISTSTLPYVLAPNNPEIALRLSPENPLALLAQAKQLSAELLDLSEAERLAETQRNNEQPDETKAVGRYAAPGLKRTDLDDKKEKVRDRLRSVATRLIKADPLNATGFRWLAEASNDPDRVRALMQAAVKRSRRETTAVVWLLNDSYYRKDWVSVLEHADTVLRTRAQLTPFVVAYLGQLAENSDARKLLMEKLIASPSWRGTFFNNLPKSVSDGDTPLKLMIELNASGSAVTEQELRPYLDFLVGKKRVDLAYNAWLQLLPEEQLSSLGLLQNASFDKNPTGLPFDWRIANPRNAVLEFVSDIGNATKRALHVSFGVGRVRFPEVSQVVVLAPGRYQVRGRFKGKMVSKRGLRWQVRCVSGKREVLGQTEMFLGQVQAWQDFVFEVQVADNPECRGQFVRLYHASRSASEELITGEAWFDDLRISKVIP